MSRACFFFQAEDGIRDLVRSRGLGDVYKRQAWYIISASNGAPVVALFAIIDHPERAAPPIGSFLGRCVQDQCHVVEGEPRLCSSCLLYTSDAADERSSVDLGGRRIIKKKHKKKKKNNKKKNREMVNKNVACHGLTYRQTCEQTNYHKMIRRHACK